MAIYCFLQAESDIFFQQAVACTGGRKLESYRRYLPYLSCKDHHVPVCTLYALPSGMEGRCSCPHEVIVQHWRCGYCGYTHALLSSALFLTHKTLWLGGLGNLEASAKAFSDSIDDALLQKFYCWFGFSFLHRLRGTSPDLPSGTLGKASSFT